MKLKLLLTGLFIFLLFACLFAQVPATVHAAWNPNPAADNVVQYQLTLDSATPIIVLPATCSATQCPSAPLAVTVPTFGLHSLSIVACNLFISGDPASIQCGPPDTISFTLAIAPVVVAGGKVTK